jgi:hypothetical protein
MMTRIILPQMLIAKRGLIINISSVNGDVAVPKAALYSATKGFVTFFSQALHEEYKDKGITVQVLALSVSLTVFRKFLPSLEINHFPNIVVCHAGTCFDKNGADKFQRSLPLRYTGGLCATSAGASWSSQRHLRSLEACIARKSSWTFPFTANTNQTRPEFPFLLPDETEKSEDFSPILDLESCICQRTDFLYMMLFARKYEHFSNYDWPFRLFNLTFWFFIRCLKFHRKPSKNVRGQGNSLFEGGGGVFVNFGRKFEGGVKVEGS